MHSRPRRRRCWSVARAAALPSVDCRECRFHVLVAKAHTVVSRSFFPLWTVGDSLIGLFVNAPTRHSSRKLTVLLNARPFSGSSSFAMSSVRLRWCRSSSSYCRRLLAPPPLPAAMEALGTLAASVSRDGFPTRVRRALNALEAAPMGRAGGLASPSPACLTLFFRI